MKLDIDHILPTYSKYYGCLDVPYRYAHRHIYYFRYVWRASSQPLLRPEIDVSQLNRQGKALHN